MTEYAAFLERKALTDPPSGFAADDLNAQLFPFQRDLTRWALRHGRSALFTDCGTGKTAMQLEWAHRVAAHTDAPVLILTPLAVAQQTVREGEKFGIVARYAKNQSEATRITVTNYDRLDHFDPSAYGAVVLDESSILKSMDGATRTALIGAFGETPYRLCCTATPAPNDYMELGNHSEFLGVLTRSEMLATFFCHDGGETQKWRLKGHAEHDFWKWLCSWAVTLRRPSDLGYDDDGFVLPPLNVVQHTVAAPPSDGALFAFEAQTLGERLAARRASVDERVARCAALVNETGGTWLIWCNLNTEADALTRAIPGAVNVQGSDDRETKQSALEWFAGLRCLCCDPEFSDKLAAWQTRSPEPTSSDTTQGIGSGGSQQPAPTSAIIVARNASTCASGSPETENTSGGIAIRQRSNETRDDENCTPRTNTDESDNALKFANGRTVIQTSDSHRGSSHTVSRQATTELSSLAKGEDAQFAASQNRQTLPSAPRMDAGDSTLTIAIRPEPSEDFFAPRVILESVSSVTMPVSSCARRCTCGHGSDQRVMISKSSIAGYGMNFQTCHQVAFVGLSDSWEAYYQAIRRCWRFGQDQPVTAHVITAETEGAVVANIKRKEAEAVRMGEEMVKHMKDITVAQVRSDGRTRQQVTYATDTTEGKRWTMHLGDCVDVLRGVGDASVAYSIFSPPFASLYTYSASDRDMGNVRTHAEFYEHFNFCVAELARVLMPGRLVSFHCMNLPTSKVRDGVIGISDFRGDLIRLFQEHGFIYHSEVVIWKDPVTAMQRTKALGLLHKTIRTDSSMSRQGIPDYLVTMRKPGENTEPIAHAAEDFPVSLWQRYASPVWMDINPSDTLQYRSAREHKDERHIAPLQLEVIRRALMIWSNPDDLILSPFAGIGSEGHVALEEGRRFLGIELKPSYYQQACRNLRQAEGHTAQDLFAEAAAAEEASL